MVVPDFKIRTNLENSNNAFPKTKSGPGVKLKKKRTREERHRVGKVKLNSNSLISLTLKLSPKLRKTKKGTTRRNRPMVFTSYTPHFFRFAKKENKMQCKETTDKSIKKTKKKT